MSETRLRLLRGGRMRFDDLKLIDLLKDCTPAVAAQKLGISENALYQRLRRLRIKYLKTRFWLNYYEAQRKRKDMIRLLTPTRRESEIAKLEYEEEMERLGLSTGE